MNTDSHDVCCSELKTPVTLRIVSMSGHDQLGTLQGEIFIKITLYCNRRKLRTGIYTAYKPTRSQINSESKTADEWMQFPTTYAELHSDAFLHVTLWDVRKDSEPVCKAQCLKYLFSKHGVMRIGQFDLKLQKAKKLDEESQSAQCDLNNSLKEEKLIKLDKLKNGDDGRSLLLTIEMRPILISDSFKQQDFVFYAPDIYQFELPDDPKTNVESPRKTQSLRAADFDRRLQPNSILRDKLETIIKMPTSQPMSTENRDMIWKFRFWLKDNPLALTKFVRSVNWDEKLEVKQAIHIMREWQHIDACYALELLGPHFAHPFVRRYAVWRLQTTPFKNLLLYLPQLVQSLRYEAQISQKNRPIVLTDENDEDTKLLLDEGFTVPTYSRLLSESGMEIIIEEFFGSNVDTETFLIDSACRDKPVANFLFWYLKVEVEANQETDTQMSNFYASMIEKLKSALSKGSASAYYSLCTITAQCKFVETLVKISNQTTESGGGRDKKLTFLKNKLSESSVLNNLKELLFPLDPTVKLKSVQPESTQIFASKLMPMRLTFLTTSKKKDSLLNYNDSYMVIFKRGDDLRQDQLILQIIRLMDKLLKEDKLDLCLTPYSVLATSISDGFVQYVKAVPIADLKTGILDYLRMHRPQNTGPHGIESEVVNNYVRSCAGYSMISYVLGIGDRHMHNLLLQENGRMFHIDFGYILGRDPKPMPPLMKLTTEMVNAMGGQNSEHFQKFVKYCISAFLIIRRHANLIIDNLFSLMLDSNIPGIAIDKDKAEQTIRERFHLQLSDEDASKEIERVIQSSISAKIAAISDFVHNAKYMFV